MTSLLAVLTATVVGLLVGVELAVAAVVNPILARLPAGPALDGRADGARRLGRTMPFWYAASLALTVALTIAAWPTASATAAAVLLLISVLMSVTLLVPISNRSARWTADEHPPDWRDQLRRWDRLHHVRVGVLAAAFVLVLVATTTL
ncbi:hypothetical protein BJF85_10110 [Saccharomonospora sp. CUA-673]|uniref:DUF1772 domain-containing protein n=1 Tax=Saccharomonospora sp. CUA-673 TaxID=1904969 RepID=UPI00095BF13B|nr:DUF1772 domain-containing protein [Saccharomonospora sp. CUA-673]OLT49207.1 hypothetical protein BJF85_10110 [Saccharomonospora sp. CUA-673]